MSSPRNSHKLLRRVKLYVLHPSVGNWEDKGTGFIDCIELNEFPHLIVRSEEDDSLLLHSRLHSDKSYNRQGDTIICWTDPETKQDYALSFQEAKGMDQLWDLMTTLQSRYPLQQSSVAVEYGQEFAEDYEGINEAEVGPITLPEVDMKNLDDLVEVFADIPAMQREAVAYAVISRDVIGKVVELFHQLEDLESTEDLQKLFLLMRSLILLNRPQLFEILLAEPTIFDVIGILEYDPDYPVEPNTHRNFLKNQAVFKEVVPIRDESVIAKIHQSFRVTYLKDTVLPRILDDGTFGTLNSLIFTNNVAIVSALREDENFLGDLFLRLSNPSTSPSQVKDIFFFLQEFCNLARSLFPADRNDFYRSLANRGMFSMLEPWLVQDDDKILKLAITEILMSSLLHDPTLLRQSLLTQTPKPALLTAIVTNLVRDEDVGVIGQAIEILSRLVDPEGMQETPEKDEFLGLFYDNFINLLVEPIEDVSVNPKLNNSRVHICDFLGACIQQHQYRIKYYLLKNNILTKVSKLLASDEQYIQLAAIRFFRTCIGANDDFYNRHIIKMKLFKPIFRAFERNGARYNLLNSSIVELVDFIVKENIKNLVSNIVEEYSSCFENVNYVSTFEMLRTKYEQNKDFEENGPHVRKTEDHEDRGRYPRRPPPGVRDQSDSDDEAYFNRDSDEDEPGPHPAEESQHYSSEAGSVEFHGDRQRIVDLADEEEEVAPVLQQPRTDEDSPQPKPKSTVTKISFGVDGKEYKESLTLEEYIVECNRSLGEENWQDGQELPTSPRPIVPDNEVDGNLESKEVLDGEEVEPRKRQRVEHT